MASPNQSPPPSPPGTTPSLQRFGSRSELDAALADRLERALTESDAGPAAVMLSGGSTPLPAYRLLAARAPRPAPGLVLLYSDDRYVPSSSDASNYHQTRPLLDALALPPQQVLRVATELSLSDAAADYERRLAQLFERQVRIRLGLLGLGADGHTASLFSAADLARTQGRLALAVHRPDGRDAVSVTPAVLTRAEQLLFVVAGEDKRSALRALLQRSSDCVAWRAVSDSTHVEVWTEPEAWPEATA
ncbi:MAG TPA: 6-phosphogluconolactonase [Steroidobacteraceae bacterium]|nr:6-phosphogluconolactonase [Steroidobacteraceae bacterium]